MEDTDLSQDQDGQGEALETLGIEEPTEGMIKTELEKAPHMQGDGNSGETELPKGVKERLGRQEKRHARELRALRAELQAMQSQFQPNNQSREGNPYSPDATGGEGDDQIQRAVAAALQAQEAQARKQREQEQMAHVYKKYQSLDEDLNRASDKYEDFDAVVRSDDAPFTAAMRDAALMIDNPAEVLYKLGKDKDALKRISNLHPLEQAREIVKLSHALLTGSDKSQGVKEAKPIGQIKHNPISSSAITEQTSPAEIRRRMKSGEWRSNRTTR